MKHLLIRLLVLGLLLSGVACRPTKTEGPAAADFEAVDLEGNVVKLSDYFGDIVVLNFWAIWCGPCRAELPDLEEFYRENRDKGVIVLAVNLTESADEIQAFVEQNDLTMPIIRDSELNGAKGYNIKSIPTTYFIDREGKIRATRVGMMTKAFVEEQVEPLL